MYSRKWTQMGFFYKMRVMKQMGKLEHAEDYALMMKFQPDYMNPIFNDRSVLSRGKPDKYWVNRILKDYPELKYVGKQYIGKNPIYDQSQEQNIYNMVQRIQKELSQGYGKEQAYKRAQQYYQNILQKKMDNNRLSRGLAYDNRMRSFLNLYQQQAEYEGRMKANRMYQDYHKRQQIVGNKEQIEIDNIINWSQQQNVDRKPKDYEELVNRAEMEGGDVYDHDLSDYDESSDQKQKQQEVDQQIDMQQVAYKLNYQRVLHKIIRNSTQDDKKNMFNMIDNFKESNEGLFKHYYERASMLDKLGGLSQNELKGMLQDSPVKFKKMMRKLDKILKKNKIKLKDDGEVDWSECQDRQVIDKYYGNPYVQMVLMEKDLLYEVPFRLQKFKEVQEYQQKISELQTKEYADFEKELSKEEQEEESFNLQFVDLRKREKDYMPSYRFEDENEASNMQAIYQKDIKNRYLDDTLNVIENKNNFYRFFESYGERLKRIQCQWYALKIQQNQKDVGQGIDQIQKTLDLLRRLKWRMEERGQAQGLNLFFEEHVVYDKEEINLAADINYETLLNYFYINQKKRTPSEQHIYSEIQEMATPRVINLDIIDPIHEQKLNKKSFHHSKESFDAFRQEAMKTYTYMSIVGQKSFEDFQYLAQKQEINLDKEENKKYELPAEQQRAFEEAEVQDSDQEKEGNQEETGILNFLKQKTRQAKKKSVFKSLQQELEITADQEQKK